MASENGVDFRKKGHVTDPHDVTTSLITCCNVRITMRPTGGSISNFFSIRSFCWKGNGGRGSFTRR